jgi:hypothetical protein
MWPKAIDWQQLKFGVEIEFVGGSPQEIEVLPGWFMDLNERQTDDNGSESGSELKTPPIQWKDKEQIRVMLARLRAQETAKANWNCGLHVHIGLEPWGESIIIPMIESALMAQEALRTLLNTSEARLQYCPPLTEQMLQQYKNEPCGESLRHRGRPQSHRCGINTAAWYDIGTVEIRYANGSLDADEVLRTVELCLRFIAAVGEGCQLPDNAPQLAARLGASLTGYPPAQTVPQWYKERIWLEETLIPILTPQVEKLVPGSEILSILPVPEGLRVTVELPEDGIPLSLLFAPLRDGWKPVR